MELSGEPPLVVLEDYPSVRDQPEVATAEFGHLSAIGKSIGTPTGPTPRTFRGPRLS